MQLALTKEEKEELEHLHKKERDGRITDRIKAVFFVRVGVNYRLHKPSG